MIAKFSANHQVTVLAFGEMLIYIKHINPVNLLPEAFP